MHGRMERLRCTGVADARAATARPRLPYTELQGWSTVGQECQVSTNVKMLALQSE